MGETRPIYMKIIIAWSFFIKFHNIQLIISIIRKNYHSLRSISKYSNENILIFSSRESIENAMQISMGMAKKVIIKSNAVPEIRSLKAKPETTCREASVKRDRKRVSK